MNAADRIETPSLVLERLDPATARAILDGDLSGVRAGDGWPHDDTFDGLRMAVEQGAPLGWLVLLDGVVIGDCGTHGPADEQGDVEIGYGLAAPFRGRGYGTELVRGLATWQVAQPGVRRVTAGVEAENVPSWRALERAGFTCLSEEDGKRFYALVA
jgi:RimJ/RimL family protein N-acetyltransferase